MAPIYVSICVFCGDSTKTTDEILVLFDREIVNVTV